MADDSMIPPKKVKATSRDKPDLPKWLFWDVRYDTMDWHLSHRYVIERILDRGRDEDVTELVLSLS
jgi:hypothetical protein